MSIINYELDYYEVNLDDMIKLSLVPHELHDMNEPKDNMDMVNLNLSTGGE